MAAVRQLPAHKILIAQNHYAQSQQRAFHQMFSSHYNATFAKMDSA
jgi:hypothetical protein